MLRGALGTALRKLDFHGLYRRVFDGGTEGSVRAYRIRQEPGIHGTVPAGQPFRMDLDLFADALGEWPAILEALERAGHAGLGEERVRCRLASAFQAMPEGWHDAGGGRYLRSTLGSLHPPGRTKALWFVAPTAFKVSGNLEPPTPKLVLESARRRLEALFGAPFPGECAELEGQWEWREQWAGRRRSRRAGRHLLQGWMGVLRLTGAEDADTELLLSAAEGLGVGRHVVLGLGDVRRILA
jgi:hypothetical protein